MEDFEYRVPYLEIEDDEDSSEDEQEEDAAVVQRRYLRDIENPLERFNDQEFRKRFRFSKTSILHGLLPRVVEHLEKPTKRGLPISPLWQVLICLRFYAAASSQVVHADLAGIHQSSVSRVIARVSDLFAGMIGEIIRMPQGAEARAENHRLFQQLGRGEGAIGLPGIDGAIDCTHVRLVGTPGNELSEIFRNRKGYFSLNVQAVVGPRTEFLDIVPEYAGSVHDSRILQNSLIHMRYVQQEFNGMLVGDAGYAASPFLLTPISNPASEEHRVYNVIHSRTRMVVERTFGIWKRRFPCLSRGLGTKMLTSTTIVVACAVLHNLALVFNDVLQEEEVEEEDEGEVPIEPPRYNPEQGNGCAVREDVIRRIFG